MIKEVKFDTDQNEYIKLIERMKQFKEEESNPDARASPEALDRAMQLFIREQEDLKLLGGGGGGRRGRRPP